MTDKIERAEETPKLKPDSLTALVEDYKELEKTVAPFAKMDEMRARIISALPVKNKYVKVGRFGVAKAHSHWGNYFLNIQDWTDDLNKVVLEDR